MKAFLIGLIFLIAVSIFTGIGIFLSPFLLIFAWIVRLIIGFLLIILAIWLLGKFIIFIWENIK
jgi:hypothetical protein